MRSRIHLVQRVSPSYKPLHQLLFSALAYQLPGHRRTGISLLICDPSPCILRVMGAGRVSLEFEVKQCCNDLNTRLIDELIPAAFRLCPRLLLAPLTYPAGYSKSNTAFLLPV
jgi:hypothetical protein